MNVSARGFVRDKSRLADDESARYSRTRGIVFDGKIGMDVLVVCTQSGQRCHNHSVLRGNGADLDGLKELRCGHCKAGVWFRGLLGAEVAT